MLKATAGLALFFATAPSLLANRPPPQFECHKAPIGIRCEAQFVYPVEPEWTTTSGGRLHEKEHGKVAFLTVDEQWRTIRMRVGAVSLCARVRFVNGKGEFLPVDGCGE